MRLLFRMMLLGAATWSVALLWFLQAMPTQALPVDTHTQALVVLTGGQGRVEHGLEMLAMGAAPVLFISGVGEHVTREQILAEHASPAVRRQIDARGGEIILDRIARSTVSNADQSAEFIRARGIHSIRLITANYHMLRSLHEFRAANPTLTIIADPVFPDGFARNRWWEHANTRRLIFSEFYKYVAVLLRDTIRPKA